MLVASAVMLLALCAAGVSSVGAQAVSSVGRWIGPYQWDGGVTGSFCETAIHTSVLRGRGDSTVVFHFAFSELFDPVRCPRNLPRVLVIPPNTQVSAANFAQLPQAVCPVPEGTPDIFCSGHATMADGRLLVVGGTTEGINGHKQALIFDPKRYSDSIFVDPALNDTLRWGWALLESDTMKAERYYPTALQLPDNRVLVSSGLQYFPMIVFGGQQANAAAVDSVHTLALTLPGQWTRHVYRGPPNVSAKAPPRRDFALGYTSALSPGNDLSGTVVMFGGHNGTTALNDFWATWRQAWNEDDSWAWWNPQPSPGAPWPTPRSQHAAVVVTPGPQGNQSCTMWVYGGMDASGAPSAELWKLHFWVQSGGLPSNLTVWAEQVSYSPTDAPGARFGHTAVLDEYELNSTTTLHRMLIYGGKTGANAWADNAVYSLDLDAATPTWSIVTPASPDRGKRYRHVAVMDGPNANEPTAERRMLVFGGVGENGTLLDDIVKFARPYNSLTTYAHAAIPPTSGPTPAPRAGHAAIRDAQWERLIVFGGDTTGTSSFSNSVWAYPLDRHAGQAGHPPLAWTRLNPAALSDLPGKAGHAAFYYPIEVNARTAEVFDVTKPRGQRWTELPSARYYTRESYPFVVNLPNGNVLNAGRNARAIFNSGAASNASGTRVMSTAGQGALLGDALPSFIPGTSAVMYDTMNVIKIGKALADPEAQDFARAAKFTTSGTTGSWLDMHVENLPTDVRPERRVEPNMTVLPNGKVFVSGGREDHKDASEQFPFPQLWDPATGVWTTKKITDAAVLPRDPSSRGYHSTAVLLPDGHVLSAGGHADNKVTGFEKDQLGVVTFYEPPYLFKDAAATPSSRPAFTSAPDSIGYGYHFDITCNVRRSLVQQVVLVRPGATTHAFNQDQRFVPLVLDTTSVAAPLIRVSGPSSAKVAAPGQYLLFVVATTDAPSGPVPSYGRWVRVDDLLPGPVATLAAQEPTCVPGVDNSVTLTWTAVADDEARAPSGKASEYKLRMAAGALHEANFLVSGAGVTTGTPGTTGSQESVTIPSFASNTLYWARLKVKDTARWSTLSNPVSFYCDDSPGGGTPGDCQVGDCPPGTSVRGPGSLSALPGQPAGSTVASTGNSVLDGTATGSPGVDYLPLPPLVPDDSGHVAIWLQAGRSIGLDVNEVALVAVERNAGEVSFVDAIGQSMLGVPAAVSSAVLNGREDVTARLAMATQAPLRFETGDVLDIEFPGTGNLALELRGRRLAPLSGAASGVEVLSETPGGGWQTSGRWLPRRRGAAQAFAVGASGHVRLAFATRTEVAGLAMLTSVAYSAAWRGSAMSAQSGDRVDQLAAVAHTDALGASLIGGDSLAMTFEVPPPDTSHVRDWYLRVAGNRTVPQQSGSSARAAGTTAGTLRYSLSANVPNPFSGSTEFRFSIPVRQRVSLEVFDLTGRRVRRFAGDFDAGEHVLAWNRRTDRGVLAPAGVYFYRMSAGRFRDQKRLIVFP